MEFLPLSSQTLLHLGRQEPCLKPVFGGIYSADNLLKFIGQKAFIVNTDPRSPPNLVRSIMSESSV